MDLVGWCLLVCDFGVSLGLTCDSWLLFCVCVLLSFVLLLNCFVAVKVGVVICCGWVFGLCCLLVYCCFVFVFGGHWSLNVCLFWVVHCGFLHFECSFWVWVCGLCLDLLGFACCFGFWDWFWLYGLFGFVVFGFLSLPVLIITFVLLVGDLLILTTWVFAFTVGLV